jgi:AIR synthase related protein, N-terminal domain
VSGEDPEPPGASTATLAAIGERGLISRLRRRLPAPGPDVLLGVGDDAAAVRGGPGSLLLTTETLLEGVHFHRSTATLRDIGAKAIVVNVSDIAPRAEGLRFLDRAGRPYAATPGFDHFG